MWNHVWFLCILEDMNDITQMISQIEQGDPAAADKLLPLVYAELRQLAARQLQSELPGQTLQPTALVHEAYMRLVGQADEHQWKHKGHFFAAAAQAMRRILIENARGKQRIKRGAGWRRQNLDPEQIAEPDRGEDLIALHESLEDLAKHDPRKAELVNLRYFGGLTMVQAAQALGISLATAERDWAYTRVWLLRQILDNAGEIT